MDRLGPLFPKPRERPRVDDWRVLSGIIRLIRKGLRWRDAPQDYGPPKILYNRFVRWSANGTFERTPAYGILREPRAKKCLENRVHLP